MVNGSLWVAVYAGVALVEYPFALVLLGSQQRVCLVLAKSILALFLCVIVLLRGSAGFAQTVEGKTLELTIVVDEMPPENRRTLRVDKEAEVFGDRVENVGLRVDEKTLGLADIFVSTRAMEPIENKEPKRHMVTFAKGNYDPPALVASKGDQLRLLNQSSVGHNPRTEFATIPLTDGSKIGIDKTYSLSKPTDRSVDVDCSIHPWLRTRIFVQHKQSCSLTDREGRCRILLLPGKAAGERSKVLFSHPSLKAIQPKEPTTGIEVAKSGVLEIDFAKVISGQKLALIAVLSP